MARTILTLKSCDWPCQNGSIRPFWHSSYATGRARMARAILALKPCNLHGCARKARAILALKFGQWHYLRARMARAIRALPTILECHNGLSHSGTQVMQLAMPECLEPFLHSSHATGRVRMARAILAHKSCNLHGCARMARAILALPTIFECHNGSSHSAIMARAILALPTIIEYQNGSSRSCTQVMPAVLEWLGPFWHSNIVGSARMARAVHAHK